MTKSRRRGVDPVEREIGIALEPGRFIPDRACFSYVSDLDEIAATIAKLIPDEPARAARLFEPFLPGARQGALGWPGTGGPVNRYPRDEGLALTQQPFSNLRPPEA